MVSDSNAREKAALPSQSPVLIIALYNYTLEYLAKVATSEELGKLDWPIPEFAGDIFTENSEFVFTRTSYYTYVLVT